LDRDHYISEAERQLKDANFYKPLDYDPTLEFTDKVSSVVEDMLKQGYISEKNKDYLIVPKPKAGRYNLLPKIHKQGIPGRLIVSTNGHPIERISEFVDQHLRSFVRALPFHFQDTTDYQRKKESQKDLPNQILLVSMDA
jgi:hypothetical protein